MTSPVYTSPLPSTINYAGLERFSPAKKFSDRRRKGPTQSIVNLARVALQVALEPGSYKVGDSQVRNIFKERYNSNNKNRCQNFKRIGLFELNILVS